MTEKKEKATLYIAQDEEVIDAVKKSGSCFKKEAYIKKKYEEVSKSFIIAYEAFSKMAERIVSKPKGAEIPYWAFMNKQDVIANIGSKVITLEVPCDEVIFFDVYDWNKVLQLRYMGTEEEEKKFNEELHKRGITSVDAVTTNFYPWMKGEIIKSWSKLLDNHEAALKGDFSGFKAVEAAIWQIKNTWIKEIKEF